MKFVKYTCCLFLLIILAGCNDEFMDRFPTDSIVEENFWNNENELKQYVNSFYQSCDAFAGHGTAHEMSPMLTGDYQSDNLVPVNYNVVAAGEHVVPPTGGGWNWDFIRGCNYFLTRYDRAAISQEQKDRYAGEVRVFKALEYFKLVKRFGDVPWLSKDLSVDSEELYAPRDSRILVMDSVLRDLDWAIERLPGKDQAEPNRINRDVALAVKARICLHEGTFRKYHGIEGSEKFLKEALNSSGTLMQDGNYQIHDQNNAATDYSELFSSLDLSANREIILYRKYETDLLGNRTVQFVQDNAMNAGVSKSLVESYLCEDGLPVSLSPAYLGDEDIDNELLNRDPRLTQTVVYPRTAMQEGLPGPAIPGTDFGGSSLSAGICPTGYQILKYWVDDIEEYLRIQNGILDAPLFRYAEVLLIHAEAAAELGICDQSLLDRTINLLRDRAGMPPMLLATVESWEGNANYQLDYQNISSALINEIRRERRVELAIEGFRYDDLMRWREGKLLENRLLGMKFVQSVYPEVVVGQDLFLTEEGYIWPYAKSLSSGRKFDENKHYYFPLPTEELVLNPNLEQNPNW